jgi:cytoskeleton protein RodZ
MSERTIADLHAGVSLGRAAQNNRDEAAGMSVSGAKTPIESVASVTDLAVKRVSVGKSLRRARERKRITLAEVADSTRILTRYLMALEEDAPADAYPAPVYARAFLREYARFIGLDAEKLVAEWKATHEEPEEPIIELIPVPKERGRLTPWGVGVICAAVFLAMLLAPTGHKPSSSPRTHTSPRSTAAATKPPPARANATAAPAPARAITMTIQVDGGRCWVQATADGKSVLQKTFTDGSSQTLHASRKIDLVLGNAGVVTLTVNGKSIDAKVIGGSVWRLTVLLDNGRVRVVSQSSGHTEQAAP